MSSHQFPKDSPNHEIFFEKFTNLKTLKVSFDEDMNWNILSQLLEKNSFENVELFFGVSFKESQQLMETFKNHKFKKLKLSSFSISSSASACIISKLMNCSFWSELEELETGDCFNDSVVRLLEKVKMPKLRSLKLIIVDGYGSNFGIIPLLSVCNLSIE